MSHDETKLDSLLVGLLYALGSKVYRTKLVKMTYLIDEANYRFRGSTITGLTYFWDNYGPNAAGNDIVAALDRLEYDGTVTKIVGRNAYGNPTYRYQIAGEMDVTQLSLTNDDWHEIQAAVQKFKGMTVPQITRASKDTKPVKRAGQYDTLHFEQDKSLEITECEIANDPFLRDTLSAIDNDLGERVSLRKLREHIA